MPRVIRPTIVFDTRTYEFAHGHGPRGRGSWAFERRGHGEVVWAPGSMTYSDAKRWVKGYLSALRGVVVLTVAP